MTSDAFDRLLYTDCRAGTGRGAGGGFQVQAQSAGVDSAQSRMAVGWLLYEAQNAWITQRRPVEDFPPGFAHACDVGYGTAQSRYVGKEATGGRQGNHLADCLLTRDPDWYGSTRPAQLWRAGLWRAGPWDTKDCPQFSGELSPGPLTVDAVAEWLRDRAERVPVLSRLLSVLEDPAGRRVVIVATDPDEAMMWIAAATLMMPMRVALDLSFKVFSANPARASQRIVAVPKELNPQLAPGRGESSFILDADECAADDAETSERARFLVGHLASVDDPYDLIDAAELAESLEAGRPAGSREALLTAWAVTRPSDPLTDPAALFQWLAHADAPLLKEYGIAVAATILDGAPSAEALRWIDHAVAHARIGLDPFPVRAQLLNAELAEARKGIAPAARDLAPVPLSAEARRDADSELSSAIVLSPDDQVDLLLRLARRHGIELELSAPVQDRLRQFVIDWIEHGATYEPRAWARRDEVLDATYDELRGRLEERGVQAVSATLRRLYRYFTGRPSDPADPLDRHLRVAAIAGTPARDRPALVRALLRQVAESPAAGPAAAVGLQEALLDWNIAGPDEALEVLLTLPGSIEVLPEIANHGAAGLADMTGKPTERMLDILAILDHRGHAPRSERLTSLLAADRNVRAFTEGARSNRIAVEPQFFRKTVTLLSEAEPAVVKVRLRPVLSACLACRHPGLGGRVVSTLESPLPRLLIDQWAGELSGGRSIAAAVWAVNCCEDPELPAKRWQQIASAVAGHVEKLSPTDSERWYREVQRQLKPHQDDILVALVSYEAPKPRRNLWIRRNGE